MSFLDEQIHTAWFIRTGERDSAIRGMSIATRGDVDEPQGHSKCKKPDAKGHEP